jgi:hypothetical protein
MNESISNLEKAIAELHVRFGLVDAMVEVNKKDMKAYITA